MFKDFNGILSHWTCVRTKTGVKGRLSAAGLTRWEFHAHAAAVKHVDHRLPGFGEECIDQTGDEELYGRHTIHFITKMGGKVDDGYSPDIRQYNIALEFLIRI
jgi:hypothetical protein